MMRIGDVLYSALVSLQANKLRSGLTTLGIIIGVGAVVAMLAITTGFERFVNEQFSGLGSNTFQLQKHPHMRLGGRRSHKWRERKNLTVADAKAIRVLDEAVRFVGSELWTWGATLRSRHEVTPANVVVCGGSMEFAPNNGYDIAEGRNLNDSDLQHERTVVVLGADLAAGLFPYSTSVGQHITFAGRRFRVAGVFAGKGSGLGGGSRDNLVIIPISTFVRIYGGRRSVNITVQAMQPEVFDYAKDRAIQIMRQRRGLKPGKENDFTVFSNESTIEMVKSITDNIVLAALGIAIISLLVGGIGIMNIMMVSVTERTREIGTRRALGARKRHILVQFTMEAIILSALGGVLGLGLGFGAAYLADALAGLPAAAPLWAVIVALSIASASGLIFGIYPAWRASRLDPIEALRHE
ncbi:MAG: ABC transporter permease [Deltaproteobacteria bacterium]|nr:ABC transporter permease [Deltaproteobacteria bacterium]